MQILSEADLLGVDSPHPDAQHVLVLRYRDGNLSHIPKGLFRNNHDEDIVNAAYGRFYIGRDSSWGRTR